MNVTWTCTAYFVAKPMEDGTAPPLSKAINGVVTTSLKAATSLRDETRQIYGQDNEDDYEIFEAQVAVPKKAPVSDGT